MMSKKIVTILVLCLVQCCLSKPAAESNLNDGRGFGSTLWDWLTYPFSWLLSDTEQPPINGQFKAPLPRYDQNISIWCNDHTCTTQKCDIIGCWNITCSIYDTDLRGECREYQSTSAPEDHVPPTQPLAKPDHVPQPTQSLAKPDHVPEPTMPLPKQTITSNHKVIEAIEAKSTTTTVGTILKESPLPLEAAMSSTVEKNEEKMPNYQEVTNNQE